MPQDLKQHKGTASIAAPSVDPKLESASFSNRSRHFCGNVIEIMALVGSIVVIFHWIPSQILVQAWFWGSFSYFLCFSGLIWQVLAPLWVDLKPTRQGQKYSAEICGSWGPNPANLWFFPWFFENIGLCTGFRLIQPPPKDHFYKNYLRCNSEVNPSDAWGAPHPISIIII